MKRISSLAFIPFLVALGACSSSGSQNQVQARTGDGGGAGDDGGVGDETTTGDDSNTSSATEFDAVLTGGEVVPTPVVTTSTGTAKFFLQADGQTLAYDITNQVPGATAVNLHVGPPGENTTVTHPLTPLGAHMTGSVMLTMDEQNAIAVDGLYVDVQSMAYPSGEVRGQITPPGSVLYTAIATGDQELPMVVSPYKAHGSFILSADMGNVRFHISTTATPMDVIVHRAIAAMTGTVAFPLSTASPVGATMDGVLQLANGDADDLQNGRFYLNIVTAANPTGELRGQFIPPGSTLFAGVLSGGNEVPPIPSMASGGAQFVLSPDQTHLHYEAVVNGVIPTEAEVDNGVAGQTGAMIIPLMLSPKGALGDATMNPSDTMLFLNSAAYMNVKTASYVNGELRAQLTQP
jgi:hypothetical protein